MGTADQDRVTGWIDAALPARLAGWLPHQRWFAAKSRQVASVAIVDVIWLSHHWSSALAVIDLTYASGSSAAGSSDRYAIVLGFYDDDRRCPLICRTPWQPEQCVIEAAGDRATLFALLDGFVNGAALRGVRGGELTYADATSRIKQMLSTGPADPPPMASLGAEQSNTSVRLGSTHIFKLFRRLEIGENPQLEIGRFLTRTTFRAASPLEGSITYRAPDGRPSTLGIVEGWIANEGDGWSYLVSRLREMTMAPSNRDVLLAEIFALGTTTADLHVALASDDTVEAFAPEPVTPDDRTLWRATIASQSERAMVLVEHHHQNWVGEASRLGQSLLRARSTIAERLRTFDLWSQVPLQKIRVHGDYHLGQVLKTPAGFALIDFEGEPTRPLGERRRKQCALKDVAGMIRSFQYAAQSAREHGGDSVDPPRVAAVLRDAFLEGYRTRAVAASTPFLPTDPAATEAWIRFFELEKALYEIEYEINNRPAWVHIPLRGMLEILAGDAS
jgi:maltose alpha-D-glucosyltransferase/alpha-amylase